MNRFHHIILAVACCFLAHTTAAQDFRFISGGGPIILQVESASAGAEPVDATDSSTQILWDANFGVPAKIAVSTIAPGQSFHLYLRLSVSDQSPAGQGVTHPEVELFDGMLDMDLFTDIPSTLPGRQGFGTLMYRASATVADGNSNEHQDDAHIVLFTLLAQ